ncbi:MAG: PEP/pyruvate-binding domain-containing protein [Candidatus Nanoarchaeia archaeon]|nr:PEP/pyruvate-binding domain-containing protein [Candidatus Nanoarchaeia archaeon]MDD5740716.1 PEP/pyruvate-binding domain-containing protein [Candidatus Nanoarchaeia archaeon]
MVKKKADINFSDKYIKWFSELGKNDIKIAGGKGANLGEMYNNRFPVPPGFVITADAFAFFISDIKEQIKSIMLTIDFEDTEDLEKKSKEIRKLIEAQEMPEELQTEILESYHILGSERIDEKGISQDALNILRNSQEPIFVSVRSSATTEDLADASFAGQQQSFLNVKGDADLIEFIKKCFSSLYTARSMYYRNKKGFAEGQALLAVVVQKMIDSEKSGVVFSKNPVNVKEEVVVEAVFGLGEGIVSGMINPDNYIVEGGNVKSLKIKDIKVSNKKIAIVRSGSGENKTVKLNTEKSKEQVLTRAEIMQIANYAIASEEHYGKPQDMEFAIEQNKVYIVQSRPITTTGVTGKEELTGKLLLEGLGASPGIGVGNVRLIKGMEDLPKIKKGDVLVTEMTNPDMVVSMQKSVAIVTDEGGMTCFSGDTNVLTSRGFMKIKDACELVNNNENLMILSFNSNEMKSKWKKIIAAGKRKSDIIRISISQTGKIEDNSLDLTSNHKMITFNNRDLIKKPISDILENKEMICLIDKLPNISIFNDFKKAYLLGALLSDGYHKVTMHHTGNPRRGVITFTQKEIPEKKEFIDTVKEYFKEVFDEEFTGREFISNSNLRGRQISGSATHFTSTKLAPAMEITRISQNLDKWTLRLDEISSLNFLAGLIDGDGCFFENRLHLYVSKENILQGVILSCLNLGIFPQVTKNRNIYHIQILERMQDILSYTKRVKGKINQKIMGNKLFSAKQILGDIINYINLNGKIKPYIKSNLLIDSYKLNRILHLCNEQTKKGMVGIINSSLRMQRIKKICDAGEDLVYNLEVEADNELDHNFIVFTKKYTPLLVSNSHAAIVSREMGIPAVVGTGEATKTLKEGMRVTVDGTNGKIYEGEVAKTTKTEIKPIVKTSIVKLKVIVDLPEFAERESKSGIEEIGLTRLEGIIASSNRHLLDYEKKGDLNKYTELLEKGLKKILKHFKRIWIRSSDIRTDEFNSLEGAPAREINPMLGLHGIRFSLKHPKIFEAELKAMRKIAEDNPDKKVGVMFPQVISLEEVRQAKQFFDKVKTKNMEFGVMIETPAAVQVIESLCKEKIHFISFGTNDLTQFTLGVDRGDDNVQDLYNELHPAVLSQIDFVISVCKKYGVETSICGQAGSNKDMVKHLIESGIDSISVNADAAYDISVFINEIEKSLAGKAEHKKQEIERGFDKRKQQGLIPKEEINQEKKEHKRESLEIKREEKRFDEKDPRVITCFDCKKETKLPFKPIGNGPFYCKSCFRNRKRKETPAERQPRKERETENVPKIDDEEHIKEKIKDIQGELEGVKQEKLEKEKQVEQSIETEISESDKIEPQETNEIEKGPLDETNEKENEYEEESSETAAEEEPAENKEKTEDETEETGDDFKLSSQIGIYNPDEESNTSVEDYKYNNDEEVSDVF